MKNMEYNNEYNFFQINSIFIYLLVNITIYKLLHSSKRCGIPCFKCICTVNLTPDLTSHFIAHGR